MSEIVHCPKCHSAVSVGAGQSGQRVQCPSCLKQFLAPSTLGGTGTSAEDDDWLSLEDPPATPTSGTRPAATGHTTSTVKTENDIFDASPFEDEPDAEYDPSDLFAELPPVDASTNPASDSGSSPGAAQSIAPEEEFRVKCPVCGSVLYAKARQSGKTIKCSDCFSEVRVPKPPKKTAQPTPTSEAATFNLEGTDGQERPADPFKRSADELLKEAEREPDEEFKPNFDAPSTIGWIKSIFGIFLDPGVIIHFFGLSLLLALPAALTYAYPVFAIGMIPLAMIGVTLTVACAFAIMFGVANEHPRIEDWPTIDPTGWFESLALVITATAMAVGPAYVLGILFGAPTVLVIGLVMFAVYVAFPIILLSMLDMQSVMSPFSPDVSKSITRCQEDWGAFYFSAGCLFASLFAYFIMCSYTPASVAIGVVLSIAVVFMYFAMLGRLALAIGEVVDLAALDADEEEQEDGSA